MGSTGSSKMAYTIYTANVDCPISYNDHAQPYATFRQFRVNDKKHFQARKACFITSTVFTANFVDLFDFYTPPPFPPDND